MHGIKKNTKSFPKPIIIRNLAQPLRRSLVLNSQNFTVDSFFYRREVKWMTTAKQSLSSCSYSIINYSRNNISEPFTDFDFSEGKHFTRGIFFYWIHGQFFRDLDTLHAASVCPSLISHSSGRGSLRCPRASLIAQPSCLTVICVLDLNFSFSRVWSCRCRNKRAQRRQHRYIEHEHGRYEARFSEGLSSLGRIDSSRLLIYFMNFQRRCASSGCACSYLCGWEASWLRRPGLSVCFRRTRVRA